MTPTRSIGPRLRATTVALVGTSVALFLVAAGLVVANWGTPTPDTMSMGGKPIELLFAVAMIEVPVLGALITLRRPHAVGCIFLVLGLCGAPVLVAMQYSIYGVLTAPGAVPGAAVAAWLTSWMWAPMAAAIPVLLVVFPTGRPPSRRWSAVIALAVAAAILQSVTDALQFPVNNGLPVRSPIAHSIPREVLGTIYTVGALLWSAAMLAGGVALVLRLRRARGVERQQLKWFVYAGAFAAVVISVAAPLYAIEGLGQIASGISTLAFLLLPASAGLAVLRYRLYDIDVVIERTLVYGSLSTVIAATYVAFVVLFQTFISPHFGGSEVAVAASTLLTLALVQPLRRRIQDAVDRRFYRSRYDAARTLDGFASRMRNEVDIEAVRGDVLGVITTTLQPAHASVWLREASRGSGGN